MKTSKKRKSKTLQLIEYAGFCAAVFVSRALPIGVLRAICFLLGNFLYAVIPRRRTIALHNLEIAFGKELSEKELKKLARRSCVSFFLTAVEIVRSPIRFKGGQIVRDNRYKTAHLEDLFRKAREIHDHAGGCIFLTPHLGNWELLPYVSALIGIPLAIVIRPLDNVYLERTILATRIATGQLVIPKKNALFSLERLLKHGKSLGMLPDQSTSRGLRVEFFGKEATVTPVPAILSIRYNRPVVVVAACRTADPYYFEGYVSDPIWPDLKNAGEQAEIVRITHEINLRMEDVIRRYPEQYLWMHNRWKKSGKKPIFKMPD
jgi:KDO2-lipid IV(A) lauroyltransferase